MYHSHMELSSVLPPEISLNPGANWISLRSNVAVSSLVLRIDCGRVKTGGRWPSARFYGNGASLP